MKPTFAKLIVAATFLTLCNCFVFSSFQSAKLLTKNQFEVTPIASVFSSFRSALNGELPIMVAGVQAGYGVSNNFNIRTRYVFAGFTEFGSIHFVEIEPKFKLKENVRSFSLPIGCYSSGSIQIMPSITFSKNMSESITSNTTFGIPVGIKVFNGSVEPDFFAISLSKGLSIVSKGGNMVFRPEAGINTGLIIDPVFYVGFGISFVR